MFKKNCLGALTALGLVCVAGAAHADPRTHDGFQLRLAPGLGYLSDSDSISGGGFTSPDLSIHGIAPAFELFVGGSLAPGLALGGTFNFMIASGPSASVGGQSVTASSDVKMNFFTIGPYVDYYLDPAQGFHLLGTLGFATMNLSNNTSSSTASTGFGLGLGAGYDWWVSDEWSIGILGRFNYAHMTYSAGGATRSDNMIAPAIEFSAAFN